MIQRTDAFQQPGSRHQCLERGRHAGLAERAAEDTPTEHLYGAAIVRVEHAAGKWWAHNGEYATEVSFCPWCGLRLAPRAHDIHDDINALFGTRGSPAPAADSGTGPEAAWLDFLEQQLQQLPDLVSPLTEDDIASLDELLG
jgi:hypothetical protein